MQDVQLSDLNFVDLTQIDEVSVDTEILEEIVQCVESFGMLPQFRILVACRDLER